MNDRERMLSGKLYMAHNVHDGEWEQSRLALKTFNSFFCVDEPNRMKFLEPVLGHLGEGCSICPPFYCDKGKRISIGDHFYANTGLIILDEGGVEIGNNVQFGPRVSIYTAGHPIDVTVRNTGLEYARKVRIEDDVWIGGNTVVNPGVTVGRGSVIGSGSVVTRDIPSGVIAAGNPCRILREITEEDHRYWKEQMDEYFQEENQLQEMSAE